MPKIVDVVRPGGAVLVEKGHRLTSADRLKAWALRWSPLLVFLLVTLPVPAYFFLRYLNATQNPGEELIVAFSTFGIFAVFGLVAAFVVRMYRRLWERRLRERVAADGVTADELSLFESEL